MALIDIDWSPPKRNLRQFSIAFLVFAGLLGACLRFGHDVRWAVCIPIWAAGIVVGITGILFPRVVLPVYVVLTAIAFPIGMVLSLVILSVVYFLLLTPIGLAMRLFGYDPMSRKRDPGATTYWRERREAESVKRYFRQS